MYISDIYKVLRRTVQEVNDIIRTSINETVNYPVKIKAHRSVILTE